MGLSSFLFLLQFVGWRVPLARFPGTKCDQRLFMPWLPKLLGSGVDAAKHVVS